MKKIILFAAVAVMGLGTWACSSDDNSSTPEKPNYQEAIQGSWKESKIYYLDKDRKVVGEEQAFDNDGCGVDEYTYKDNVVTLLSNYRYIVGDVNECRSGNMIELFSIDGNKITNTYEEDGITEITTFEIVTLTEKKLVLLDLDEVSESAAGEEEWPKGTRFVQVELVRK